jgi:hypothetical protein
LCGLEYKGTKVSLPLYSRPHNYTKVSLLLYSRPHNNTKVSLLIVWSRV